MEQKFRRSLKLKQQSQKCIFPINFRQQEVEQFLNEEHTFREYTQKIFKYQRIDEDIQYNNTQVSIQRVLVWITSCSSPLNVPTYKQHGPLSQCHHINCFDVQCDELIKGLHKRTNGLVKKLLQRLMDDHNEASEQ